MITHLRRPLVLVALSAAFAPSIVLAQSPRTAGRIGEYTPPKSWPVHSRTFDLLHQRIAVSYDLDKRSMAGEVQTRLVVTAAPTDTIHLDASQLTIDAAMDAQNAALKFSTDTGSVTVHLAKRARLGDTVVFSLRYHARPERVCISCLGDA